MIAYLKFPEVERSDSFSNGVSILEITLILQALHFAADKHRDQRRKDVRSSPYINHPIAVAEVIARIGMIHDEAVLSAALLHDTIEDTHTTSAELEQHFGPAIRDIVLEVTDDKSLPKEQRKLLQIEHAVHSSMSAKLVKLGDKICNVMDVTNNPPGDWSHARRVEYLDWSERVVANLRGTNAALENYFDEMLEKARAKIVKTPLK